MPEIEPRIVQIVVKYSAITSFEDVSDNSQCCLRGTDIGTELHQQWLFQHRTAKQVCPPYLAGLYGDIQIKINTLHYLLQQSRPTLTGDTLRKNSTNSYIIQNTITWHKEDIMFISNTGLVWTPVLYQEV